MSTRLAPIHEMMYRKILFQEDLTDRILAAFGDEAKELAAGLDAKYGETDRRPLAESIDLSNIHGWLSGRIDRAEGRYADAVSGLVSLNENNFTRIVSVASAFGADHPLQADTSVEDAATFIQGWLLSGMPCDRVVELVSVTNDSVTLHEVKDCHSVYWKAGDADLYRALRTALVNGMLSSSPYVLTEAGDYTYEIARREAA